MATETRSFFQSSYEGDAPPWDIGRPQRDLLVAFDLLPATGSALDVGCGTGEHVLELARRGLDAWGLDATAAAITWARAPRGSRAEGLLTPGAEVGLRGRVAGARDPGGGVRDAGSGGQAAHVAVDLRAYGMTSQVPIAPLKERTSW